ncbi:MAG: T9SS type A sorting domain-containing protein, partial [Flavobacteriales bacterium]|nr:T9SS type A sorting domain-containing protein [Flavobacteriales bacterium]
FGSTTLTACGVSNNTDCDDNLLTYADNDNDGFGSTTLAACGVANNTDCDDNLLTYVDNDNDGFGSTTLTACGVSDNTDCDDSLLTYADNDNDGFGSTTLAACGVADNSDCNDNQIQYMDADNDGFGTTTMVACGATNSDDCDDNSLTYADNDNDGFGSTTLVACGITNNTDCNDNQILYMDTDGDGFGTTTMVACGGSIYNSDCDDANPNVRPILVTKMNQTLSAPNVVGAQGYRFRVTNLTTNEVRTIDRNLRTFNLAQLSNYAYNTTFYVEVAVKINNEYSSFTRIPACAIITPMATTKIQATQCGITISDLNTFLYADNVTYIDGYRFRIIDTENSSNVQIYDSPIRSMKLNMLNNIELDKTYSIEVAVKNHDGTYLPFGVVCNVTTASNSAKINDATDNKEISATVAPNPFTDAFSLKLENSNTDKINIAVYDLMGRSIENKTLNKGELESITLGNDYPTGVYTLIISIGDEIKNIRIVKR